MHVQATRIWNKNTRDDCNFFIEKMNPPSPHFHNTYDDPHVFNGRPIFYFSRDNDNNKNPRRILVITLSRPIAGRCSSNNRRSPYFSLFSSRNRGYELKWAEQRSLAVLPSPSLVPSLHGLIAADLNGDLNARDFPPLPTFQREQFVGVSRPISTVRLSIAWRSMKVIVVAWIAIWFTREGEIRVQGVASWRDTRLSFRDKAWEWNEIYIYIKFESKNFWIVYFARKASFWKEKNLFEERKEDIKLGK